ncbi:DUF4269 domain-containing protein [Mesorhizobium sp. B2-4-19]|uniref:DUF4269 domain-containing protein n=1 Tax=Mesorhizobium sp. B2-4-19 TaxID=2589930 RepID=UPI00112C47F7|nr:DUF4269 domain-containing protein [Mesorhizobium sp. B2-4-19]TPK59126.1 DUF4269 domain-containing protein [Mesorhizobium sp. B2-4-19]
MRAATEGFRPDYADAVAGVRVAEHLKDFDWRIVGTPPLGIATANSDIDIICHASDYERFAKVVWGSFGYCLNFSLRQWTSGGRCVVCDFFFDGWEFQVFGDCRAIVDQSAWRHFVVEQRLLNLGGETLRQRVFAERLEGLKTEPAFAKVLGLDGDPFSEMQKLFEAKDEHLHLLIARNS